MIFRELNLENFRSFDEATLGFNEGLMVIQGRNGSGKTSLLKGCFTALYGSKALDSDEVLYDLVTRGKDESSVSLEFSRSGVNYEVVQEIRVTDEGEAKTARSLFFQDGEQIGDDGIRSTREEVKRLIRMDAEAFVNCAYVRQGEVNRLINASPTEREDIIDGLLQLGKLEEYRERAVNARRGIGRLKSVIDDRVDEKESRISEIEDLDIQEKVADLNSELMEIDDELDESKDKRDKARDRRNELKEKISGYKDQREELSELKEELDEVRGDRKDILNQIDHLKEIASKKEREASEIQSEVDEELPDDFDSTKGYVEDMRSAKNNAEKEVVERREALSRLSDKKKDIAERTAQIESEIESLEKRLEKDKSSIHSKCDDLEGNIKEIQGIKERIQSSDIDKEIDDLEESLDNLKSDIAEKEARRESLKARIAEAEEMLDNGKCPKCGQEIDDSHDVEGFQEWREEESDIGEELESLRDKSKKIKRGLKEAKEVEEMRKQLGAKEGLIEEKNRNLADEIKTWLEKRDQHDTKNDELAELRDDREELVEKYSDKESKLKDLKENLEDAKADLHEAKELHEKSERSKDSREKAEDLRDKKGDKEELLERVEKDIKEKEERKSVIEEELEESDIDKLSDKLGKTKDLIKKVDAKIEAKEDERDDIQARIGALKEKQEQLESLRDELKEIKKRQRNVGSLYGEIEVIEGMYRDLRVELRKKNVERLDQLLQHIFGLLYSSDSYSKIKLTPDYELEIYEKDGEILKPHNLSGGERAIFNLSLRCAIYRLLAEGVSEDKNALPPLILDEPTVFLDDEHVSRLIELARLMTRDFGVDQVVLVSHNDEFVDAADRRVSVEKDPTTNRSRVIDSNLATL